MNKVFSPEVTRQYLQQHVAAIKASPDFGEPTQAALEAYGENIDTIMGLMHKTNRGKREISVDLNMTVSELDALFIGKTVLDIGCGIGSFSSDIARLKRTKVTALDHDPELLSQVKAGKDVTPVLGSGFDIQAAVGEEEFDVVVSAYSSLLWARSPVEKQAAITAALQVTKVGGKVLFLPVVQHVEHRARDRQALARGHVRGFPFATPEDLERMRLAQSVGNWNDVLVLDTFDQQEASGMLDCTYVSSRDNWPGKPIHPLFDKPGDAMGESYSVIVDVLGK